jgi:hypothetical protein
MIFQVSPSLRSQLSGRTKVSAFDGAAIKIGPETLERWKVAYRHIRDWAAALQAIDDYCAANPASNAKQISRASSWLERWNAENWERAR